MPGNFFQISYLVGLIVRSFVRAWYGRRYKQEKAIIALSGTEALDSEVLVIFRGKMPYVCRLTYI